MEFVDPYLRAELNYRREALSKAWRSPMHLPFSKGRSPQPSGPISGDRRPSQGR
ncbi:hypothetical protein [Ornithinicoccus hortensis]|uniref:Uncharacterized protein n=1 Tax=Ornithinicoccus hortensis TaxID=82346 RepID=A0A542YRY6_9MICO|nr:hypothetical protein [Ornithinicoccus hortensis]TQL50859.1 hypothetical protein FB467_1979 [Ornithinicoccus hortensis]